MKFLVIILTLALERFGDARTWLHRDAWFHTYVDAIRTRMPASSSHWLTAAMVILVPAALVMGLLSLLKGQFYGVPELVLSVIVLFYALGRVKLEYQLDDYLAHWRAGDFQSAYHHACEFLTEPDVSESSAPEELHASVRKAYLHHALTGIFAVLFWYFLIGPSAAVLWMLCEQYVLCVKDDRDTLGIAKLQHALEWLPARILALTLTLVGNSLQPMRAVAGDFLRWNSEIDDFLARAAVPAIDPTEIANPESAEYASEIEREWKALKAILDRCLIVCLVMSALATILGWH